MIKISWGTKIAVLYIGFAALMGVMVTLCIHQKIDLVSDDYYERELKFQNKIDQVKNADALEEKIIHRITDQNIDVIFPQTFKGKNVTGEIVFFRPSDASKDYKTMIAYLVKRNEAALLFIIFSLPFTYYVVGKYHLHMINTITYEYYDPLFTWFTFFHLIKINLSVSFYYYNVPKQHKK